MRTTSVLLLLTAIAAPVAIVAAIPAASAQAEDPANWHARGRAYEEAGNAQQAIYWVRKAAEAGHPKAQYDMARYYFEQYGGLPDDPPQLFRWMRASAQSGNSQAQHNVGLMYYQGKGTAKNFAEAARWFRRSAEQGYPEGQLDLGTSLWSGEGIPVDHAEAVQWFRKAAAQGNDEAQFWLGNAYRRGLGVAFDITEARRWLQKSAAQGNKEAASMLRFIDQVDREFAAEQRREAQRAERRAARNSGPSLGDQFMQVMERQRRENCAAAAQGANRVCLNY